MKLKMNTIFKNIAAVSAVIFLTTACDSDINTLGTDFFGIDVDNIIKSEEFEVVTYGSALAPVQTNRFTSQPFGIYVDPVFGKTTYDFVTQVSIPSANPDFGTSAVLDSVVISIPLFSSVAGVEGDNRTYRLDSVYNTTAATSFKIFENRFFLNSFNPQNLSEPATYFSDLGPVIDGNKGTLIFEDLLFVPSPREVRLSQVNDEGVRNVTLREPPAYRKTIASATSTAPNLQENINYWKSKIFDQEGTANLASISSFQNYFRGLYFQANNANANGNLTYFNLNEAAIIIYYKSLIPDTFDSNNDGSTTDLIELKSTYRLSFRGNRATLINRQLTPAIQTAIQAGGNAVQGDASLYLQGGPGSMAFVDLFGPDADMDGEADALTALKSRQAVINDATLTFFVDQSQVSPGRTEPERIIIYDADNLRILADFATNSSSPVAAVNSNTAHLGRLERVTPGNLNTAGVQYRLRLTNHISNIVNASRENSRLGLLVTQNVDALVPLSNIFDSNNANAVDVQRIFLGSAISHEGTILHGSNSPDVSKRPVFKIFYTEPN